ncbi:Fic family protein [Brevibacterium litoralis]|uniref:Fic family protein n=1 Tax=Brevibacterium litoralis TaxID=3138935 RepID=UPI0032EAD11B
MQDIDVVDLVGLVYSSGKVFDGLSTGRLDTENFLRSGSLDGVTSRSDLALLEDLRDAARFIIDQAGAPVDTNYVRTLHAQMTRSAALRPGELRRDEQGIGVRTRYGRHEPPALDDEGLHELVAQTVSGTAENGGTPQDPRENALDLFIRLARAQPFEDGNKRTALFAANGVLFAADLAETLTIPVDEDDPTVADTFNDLLARVYVFEDVDPLKDFLRDRGFVPLPVARD